MSERQEGYFVQERYVSHPRQPWEYLQEEIPQAQWQVRLAELGAEGWELVHQRETQRETGPGRWVNDYCWEMPTYLPCWLCFFKRPKGA